MDILPVRLHRGVNVGKRFKERKCVFVLEEEVKDGGYAYIFG